MIAEVNKRNQTETCPAHLQLFNFRRQTIEKVLEVDPSLLLPSVDCCSDTEDDGVDIRAVGLTWRSKPYEEFLHAVDCLSFKASSQVHGGRWATRRLDARRKPALRQNTSASICPDLPKNCYNWASDALKPLGPTQEHVLSHKPATTTLESLLSKIYAMLK